MSRSDSLLYLDGVSVSFDGFRALNELSLAIEPGEMRAVIGRVVLGRGALVVALRSGARAPLLHRIACIRPNFGVCRCLRSLSTSMKTVT